jgi:uncharacterized peroxidase-related enzyme
MRLPSYETGRRPAQRAFVALTGLLGSPINDVGKVAMRRPEFFGRPFMALAHGALRGRRSGWSVGEREMFAAVVSQANSCAFCIGTHGAIAGSALGLDVDESWRDGRFGARATAAAEFVDALTRDPGSVGPELVAAARTAGVDDAALAEAVYVAFAFNTVNRVADALGFEHRSERELRRDARFLRINGYRMPGFLLC